MSQTRTADKGHPNQVPIYSCPTSSPVRHRMLYSSAALFVARHVKEKLAAAGSASTVPSRKVETDDPTELDERYLVTALGLSDAEGPTKAAVSGADTEVRKFARPKGPGRKR